MPTTRPGSRRTTMTGTGTTRQIEWILIFIDRHRSNIRARELGVMCINGLRSGGKATRLRASRIPT
jgi:hypothetical protein